MVGMVFQKFYLIPTIDVLDNVAVTLLVRGASACEPSESTFAAL
jgi:predicted ABC-type transport system involved in lysophospholipase L1 biosynthesis ATPase subunit